MDTQRVSKGDTLRPGSTLTVMLNPGRDLMAEPDLPVPILFKDTHLVALDKPAGFPSNALDVNDRNTIANFLAGNFPEALLASDRPLDAGLVHRLDTATSGVLVAARNRDAWLKLRRQFSERQIKKQYVARIAGTLDQPLEITTPIRTAGGRQVRVGEGGRKAITKVSPLEGDGYTTLVNVETETGVRHQIRAHLAAIDHPIVGDPIYGGPPAGRLYLHALRISFIHPSTGNQTTIESPPPFA